MKPHLTHKDIAGAEEADLIRRYQAGDRAAGGRLVEAHDRLIQRNAVRRRDLGLDHDDLLQEGRIGFLHAVRKYDFTAGASLATYAQYWIRQRAQRALGETGGAVPVPSHLATKVIAARRSGLPAEEARARYTPTLTLESLVALMWRSSRADAPIGDGPTTALERVVADEPDAGELLERAEDVARARRQLAVALGTLVPRERYVVEQCQLLPEPRSMEVVGRELGRTRERVRQVLGIALRKLRVSVAHQRAREQVELDYGVGAVAPHVEAPPVEPTRRSQAKAKPIGCAKKLGRPPKVRPVPVVEAAPVEAVVAPVPRAARVTAEAVLAWRPLKPPTPARRDDLEDLAAGAE